MNFMHRLRDFFFKSRYMSFVAMKSSLVICVLMGAIFSVRAASLFSTVEAFTTPDMATETEFSDTTPIQTTIPYTPYNDDSTITANLPSPSQTMCHEGWEVFQGRCYYFVNEGMTWSQAQSNCALLDSMLASVHSTEEYNFLQQFLNNNENIQAWLGGFYLQDQWLWLDGSWFYNNSWSFELPESASPCLTLTTFEASGSSPCNTFSLSSICMKNSNVPPAMLCPSGWLGFNGRCYYFNSETLTWPQADANCAGYGASLVSVHSPQEYSFLYQQVLASGFSEAWLGGFYFDNQWMWLDGSWFYPGFFIQLSTDSSNPCLSTYTANGWTNFDCNENFPSFCVKNAAV